MGIHFGQDRRPHREKAEYSKAELKKITEDLRKAKSKCVELKKELTELPNINLVRMMEELDAAIAEINDVKAELDKSIEAALVACGKL